MNGLKIAKIAVIVMTFFLLFGFFLCLKIIHENYRKKSSDETAINLSQPDGSNIKNVVAVEKDLYIIIENGGLSDRIVVFSPDKHKVIYNISIN